MNSDRNTHLHLTFAEATARLNSKRTDDVAAYDKVHDEVLELAWSLTQGILAEYRDKFRWTNYPGLKRRLSVILRPLARQGTGKKRT